MRFEPHQISEGLAAMLRRVRRDDLVAGGFDVDDDTLARSRALTANDDHAIYHAVFDREAAHAAVIKPRPADPAAPYVEPPQITQHITIDDGPARERWQFDQTARVAGENRREAREDERDHAGRVVNAIKVILLIAIFIALCATRAKAQASTPLIIRGTNSSSILVTRSGGLLNFKCDGTSVICSWSAALNTFTFTSAGSGGAWGTITGTLSNQTDLQTALTARELTANKDAASGYAGLTAGSLLKTAEFPAFTGDCTTASGGVAVTCGNAIARTGGTAKQVAISGGAATPISYIDFPDVKVILAGVCNNGIAGSAWSLGSGGTVACRAGTNNLGAYVLITDTSSTFATFQVAIPEDWDTASNPFIRFQLASTDATNGHTIIPSIQVACYKGDGTTTDDVTANAAHSLSTTTLNGNANRHWSTSNVQMNSTDVTGCVAGALMQVTVGRATDTATNCEFYAATLTFPRLLAVQAN